MKPWRYAALLMLLGLLIGHGISQVWAHQQKEAITTVLFNTRTGNIEVMHRFLLHDAEHAVKILRQSSADLIGSAADQDWFADYVFRCFSLHDQDDRLLPLSPVGHEIDGRFFWVYAETPVSPDINALTIRHDALRDIWTEQVNLVNVERAGQTRSVAFTNGVQQLTVRLEEEEE